MKRLLSLIAALAVSAGAYNYNIQQGWQLEGAVTDMNLSTFKNNNVVSVWTYDYQNQKWRAYFPTKIINLSKYGIEPLKQIKKGEGFWISAIGNFNINIGDEKANMQGYQNSDNNSTSTKKPFITVWDVNSNSNKKNITIPINSNYTSDYDYTVNWGDGSISKNVDKSITHTYAKDGNYTVKINGVFPAIYLNNGGHGLYTLHYNGNANKLIEIKQWGGIKWKSFENAFAGAQDLKITATDTPNLKNVKNMSGAFAFDDTNTFNNINNWNVTNVTNMSKMFDDVTSFNQPLNDWNVTNVTNMSAMFRGATSFNQPLNNWDVSNVTDMGEMFRGATSFNQPLNNWDVSNVTDMGEMFAGATSFNQPLNNWNVSSVTSIAAMFRGATSFNQPLNNWDVSNVTHMNQMFQGATSFNQPLNNWDVSNVTDMIFMFQGATSFNQPLNNWYVGNVSAMSEMFYGAISFDQNISNWNVSNVNPKSANPFDFAGNGCPINGTSKMPKKFKLSDNSKIPNFK